MSTSREAFLQRVRQAVAEGNRAGAAAAPGPRGGVGYQGAGPDPVGRFCEGLTAAGGLPQLAADAEAAAVKVVELVRARGARRVLLGRGVRLDTLNLGDRLRSDGLEVVSVDALTPGSAREPFFAADVGISGVEALVAETGSVVAATGPTDPRSLNLLPPVHIAVAWREQIVPDLFDLFARFTGEEGTPRPLPSCLTVITGPSKTGDIELRLVTGVHGPGEVHVIVVTG